MLLGTSTRSVSLLGRLPLGGAAAAAAQACCCCPTPPPPAAEAAGLHAHQASRSAWSSQARQHGNTGGGGSRWRQALPGTLAAAAAAAAAAAGTAVAHADSQPQPQTAPDTAGGDGVSPGPGGKLLSLAARQRIFFKYEARIRSLSSLEKIYEYFATHTTGAGAGGKVMSAQDVVRALVPTYPPTGSDVERAGFLDGERGRSQDVRSAHQAIMAFFDTDQDGTIGFNEFLLIIIALAVPEKDVDVVFDVIDLDNNGYLDEDEFMEVLQQLERRAGFEFRFAGRAGKHAVQGGPDDRQRTHVLFSTSGGRGVNLDRFRTFLRQLQDSMLHLEFAHYDSKGSGKMCGTDFATSLVTAADIKVVDGYLDKAQSLPPQLAAASISFKEFADVAMLRRNMHLLSFALNFCTQIQRPLSKPDFSKLLVKSSGVQLSPAVLDILFAVFGDAHGLLDGPALVAVMKARNRVPGYRKGQGLGVGGDADDSSVLGVWHCLHRCVFAPSSVHEGGLLHH